MGGWLGATHGHGRPRGLTLPPVKLPRATMAETVCPAPAPVHRRPPHYSGPSAYSLLLTAFCLPPSAYSLLLTAFCLQPSAYRQSAYSRRLWVEARRSANHCRQCEARDGEEPRRGRSLEEGEPGRGKSLEEGEAWKRESLEEGEPGRGRAWTRQREGLDETEGGPGRGRGRISPKERSLEEGGPRVAGRMILMMMN